MSDAKRDVRGVDDSAVARLKRDAKKRDDKVARKQALRRLRLVSKRERRQ